MNFWRRWLCPLGLHRWKYIDTGCFTGDPGKFKFHKEQCRACGRYSYIPTE